MIYTASNVMNRTRIYDVDALDELKMVISIDTDTNDVIQARQPLQVVNDAVDTITTKYRSIYPIYGGYHLPCLFHCYGRIE